MNRTLLLGVAIFFAIVGLALMGGEQQAVAGGGCAGCSGAVVCCGDVVEPSCSGCFGRAREARHHRRAARRAQANACCGAVDVCGCSGGYVVQKCGGAVQKSGAVQKGDPIQQGGPIQTEAIEGEVPPPPTAAAYYIESGRIGFYQVGFRR